MVEEDRILVISTTDSEYEDPDERPLAPRWGTRGQRDLISEVSVRDAKANMSLFLHHVREMVADAADAVGGYVVDTVEVSAQMTAEGQIGFLGSGAKASGTATFKIVLKKDPVSVPVTATS
jgi:hypothetical protein